MLRNVMLLLNLWNSSNNNSSSNNSRRLPEEEEEGWNNSPACSSAPLLPLLKRMDKIQPSQGTSQVSEVTPRRARLESIQDAAQPGDKSGE